MGPLARLVDSHRALAAALGLAVPMALAAAALAQSNLDSLRQRDQELEEVRAEQKKAAAAQAALKREMEAIGDDRRKLNQALIDTATRLRAVEGRIGETEERLKPLDDNERSLRTSLEGRRDAIAEVLAALQRMGRHPPPAIMVRPEDALRAVRTAILLGAVLPEMRAKADSLAADLAELLRIRKEIAEEKESLQRDVGALNEERQRVAALIEARQKKQAETEQALEIERQKAVTLARQVDNLKDLIGKAELGLDSATRAARQAAKATEDKARQELKNPWRESGISGLNGGGAPNTGGLAPAKPAQ